MGKAINSLIDSQENQKETRDVVTLRFVDMLHPKGERVKHIVKKSKRDPQMRVPTKVRTVEYIYPHKDPEQVKRTKGWEVVEETLVPRNTEKLPTPKVIGHVTRIIDSLNIAGPSNDE